MLSKLDIRTVRGSLHRLVRPSCDYEVGMPFLTGLFGNLEFLHHPEISMSSLLSGCFWGSRNWLQRSSQGIYRRDLKIFFPPPPYISHRLASMQTKEVCFVHRGPPRFYSNN